MRQSKFSDEQIAAILDEALSGKATQAEVCRKHGVSSATFAIWKRKYAGVQREDLAHYREVERENAQLKKLLAERCLEVDAMKSLFKKNGWSLPSGVKERGS